MTRLLPPPGTGHRTHLIWTSWAKGEYKQEWTDQELTLYQSGVTLLMSSEHQSRKISKEICRPSNPLYIFKFRTATACPALAVARKVSRNVMFQQSYKMSINYIRLRPLLFNLFCFRNLNIWSIFHIATWTKSWFEHYLAQFWYQHIPSHCSNNQLTLQKCHLMFS